MTNRSDNTAPQIASHVSGSVRIVRTKKAGPKGAPEDSPLQWIEGTPKSDASTDPVVPLAPWLADDLREYVSRTHPFAGKRRIAHAPLFQVSARVPERRKFR